MVKSLRPVVWLTEDFPLKLEELMPLPDMLANKVKAVWRLRELLTTKFPPGTFRVKVSDEGQRFDAGEVAEGGRNGADEVVPSEVEAGEGWQGSISRHDSFVNSSLDTFYPTGSIISIVYELMVHISAQHQELLLSIKPIV
ncbi:hypothetical protein Cni_G20040 [Canna indica]|uniref:Ankyrin repeat domain-containing protein n=1 Tax=Canna indica TaxID=4628 RepID=A0AAQ3QJ59_9LILI|nr:hypothetical protein Cni_G20040 [Canna indica]